MTWQSTEEAVSHPFTAPCLSVFPWEHLAVTVIKKELLLAFMCQRRSFAFLWRELPQHCCLIKLITKNGHLPMKSYALAII
jgi:hypothetical protein